jgi:hypothetical protein
VVSVIPGVPIKVVLLNLRDRREVNAGERRRASLKAAQLSRTRHFIAGFQGGD